ncbi:MAG TPA: dipeptidase [Candidatus Hydrogenedentes bacterium]|nr:dipeptidase [Candidatus Hydrogenedentota bacterium]
MRGNIEQVRQQVAGKRDAFLAGFQEAIRIPSVSTLSERREDVRRMALWLAGRLRALGMNRVDLVETPGHPVVLAEWLDAPGRPTVLVYGHYDVQPVDPIGEWGLKDSSGNKTRDIDPFGAEIAGDYVYGRGASDMKGQLVALLCALEAWQTVEGAYPVNLRFLVEGEEEIGSVHLEEVIEAHRDRLACDIVLNCDGGILGPDLPSIVYGLRGLAYFELEVRGPGHDLHSGMFGGSVRNPIHVLVEFLAGLHDADGRVNIPGFYDAVRELTPAERELMARLPYSDEKWLALTGAKGVYGEAGYTTLERVGARPTLEINGIWGGFTGEGAKTVLPAKAHCKFSTRLVPDQTPDDVEKMVRRVIEERMPPDVTWELTVHSKGPGAVMRIDTPFMRAASDALEAVFGKPPLFVREGGSVPVVAVLREKIGVESVMLGFGLPDDNIHGPNEHQHLPTWFRGIETYITFLGKLGVDNVE